MPSLIRNLFSLATLSTYLSPSGRMARVSYFGCCLRLSLALTLAVMLPQMLLAQAASVLETFTIVAILLGVASFFCLTSQRLQDIGISGWHAAWGIGILLLAWPILEMTLTPAQFAGVEYFRPYVAPATALVLALIPGAKAQNRFGPPPPWTLWGTVNDATGMEARAAAEESRQISEIGARFD